MSNPKPPRTPMEPIPSLAKAQNKVLSDIKDCLKTIRDLVKQEPASAPEGVKRLQLLRQAVYEDINQIQHEELILRAAKFLEQSDFKGEKVDWYWNPRQTGDTSEPDLRGVIAGKIALSAEITTSEPPVGILDSRMASTLKKLNDMPGQRYYFVRTQEMAQRAMTKVSGAGYAITVKKIEPSSP
jgi:hypothetical protein